MRGRWSAVGSLAMLGLSVALRILADSVDRPWHPPVPFAVLEAGRPAAVVIAIGGAGLAVAAIRHGRGLLRALGVGAGLANLLLLAHALLGPIP